MEEECCFFRVMSSVPQVPRGTEPGVPSCNLIVNSPV